MPMPMLSVFTAMAAMTPPSDMGSMEPPSTSLGDLMSTISLSSQQLVRTPLPLAPPPTTQALTSSSLVAAGLTRAALASPITYL